MPRHTINPDLRPLDPDALSDFDIDATLEDEHGTFTPSEVSLLKTHFSPPIEDRKLALDMYVRGTINRGIHRGCCRDLRASKATQERAARIDEILAESKVFTLEDTSIVVRDMQDQIDFWREQTKSTVDQIDFMRKNMPPEQAKKLLHMWAQECAAQIKAKSSNQG